MPKNDQPFPLLHRFEQLVLPPLLLGLGIFLWSVYVQNKTMSEKVYVEIEKNYLQTIIDEALLHDEQFRELIIAPWSGEQGLQKSLSNLKLRAAREQPLQDYLCIEFVRADGRRITRVSNDPGCKPLDQTVLTQVSIDQRGTLIEDFPRPDVWTVVTPLRIMEDSTELLAVATKSSPRIKNNHHQSFKLWAAVAFFVLSLAIFVAWVLILALPTNITIVINHLG